MRLPHMRYAELRDRLHRAYLKEAQGLDPNQHGDPHTEYKLAERLRQLSVEQFGALMEHMQWDLRDKLTETQFREFVDYAAFVRVHQGEVTACDPRDSASITPYALPSNLGPIVTEHKV